MRQHNHFGEIFDIRYGDDGAVLGWSQPVLNEAGETIGTLYHETREGERRRLTEWKLSSQLASRAHVGQGRPA